MFVVHASDSRLPLMETLMSRKSIAHSETIQVYFTSSCLLQDVAPKQSDLSSGLQLFCFPAWLHQTYRFSRPSLCLVIGANYKFRAKWASLTTALTLNELV